MAKVVRHERYASVDLAYLANNPNTNLKGSNKQWWVTVYDDGTYETRYGKISGTEPAGISTKSFGSVDEANRFADKKIAEKMTPETDKKTGMVTQYFRVPIADDVEAPVTPGRTATSQTDLAKVAREQIAQGDPIVADLVARLARENIHNIMSATSKAGMTYNDTTGLFSTPMGVVTQDKIDEARGYLATAAKFVPKHRFTEQDYVDATQMYMRCIPMDLGHNRVTLDMIFPDMDAVAKQNDILESLEASLQMVADRAAQAAADGGAKVVVEPPKIFDVSLSLIESAKDLAKFRKMYKDTRKDAHVCSHLDIKRVFTVDIRTMREAFEEKGRPIGQIRQLYHGTRTANLLSILRGGLVIPPANASHCTGRLFGTGVYFANASTKSLNYAYGYWGGRGGYSENCFMFLADVAMGKPYTPRGTSSSLPAGYNSIWAKAGVSGVYNDEIIVPKVHQCNLIYLMEFSPGGK